jgi:hypothetical protein
MLSYVSPPPVPRPQLFLLLSPVTRDISSMPLAKFHRYCAVVWVFVFQRCITSLQFTWDLGLTHAQKNWHESSTARSICRSLSICYTDPLYISSGSVCGFHNKGGETVRVVSLFIYLTTLSQLFLLYSFQWKDGCERWIENDVVARGHTRF